MCDNRVFALCQPYCTARQVAMASQIVEAGASFQMELFVRGHHVYFTNWTPTVGEVLPVKQEILNEYDRFAVAIWKDEEVVEHVPKAMSKITSFFLKYDGSVVFCDVIGRRVNRDVGLGMEVPCVCKFYEHQAHIKKLQEIVNSDDSLVLAVLSSVFIYIEFRVGRDWAAVIRIIEVTT